MRVVLPHSPTVPLRTLGAGMGVDSVLPTIDTDLSEGKLDEACRTPGKDGSMLSPHLAKTPSVA